MNVLTLICMAVGGIGVVRGAWQMWEGEGSTRWPKVSGVVRGTRIQPHGGGRGPRWQSGVVEYGYQVGDHWYESDRWSYGRDNWFVTYAEADQIRRGCAHERHGVGRACITFSDGVEVCSECQTAYHGARNAVANLLAARTSWAANGLGPTHTRIRSLAAQA